MHNRSGKYFRNDFFIFIFALLLSEIKNYLPI